MLVDQFCEQITIGHGFGAFTDSDFNAVPLVAFVVRIYPSPLHNPTSLLALSWSFCVGSSSLRQLTAALMRVASLAIASVSSWIS